MKKIITVIFVIFQALSLIAQLSDAEFEALLDNEDIVIQHENMKVSFIGKKAYYIRIVVEKEIEYEILSEAGNNYLTPFVLPQPFDEIYRPHSPGIRNESTLFDEVSIEGFEATIIHNNGEPENLAFEKKIQKHKIITESSHFGYLYSYCYSFGKAEPGERIRIKYKYSFPFKYNIKRLISSRFFFVTKIPRKKFDFYLSHQYSLEVDTGFINCAYPDIDTLDNMVNYKWHFENQPGSLDEPGSRPQTNLPWLSFTLKPNDFLVEYFNSYETGFIPMRDVLTIPKTNRTANNFWPADRRSRGKGKKDDLNYYRFIDRFIELGKNDSVGIVQLREMQAYINDSVAYNDAYSYFGNNNDRIKTHTGTQLANGEIWECNKELVYATLIDLLDMEFYMGFPSDSRTGYIGEDYLATINGNEILFAIILNNKQLAYIMPKTDKRNLFCEELPFYYENTPILLVNRWFYEIGSSTGKMFFSKYKNTPSSSISENTRKINSKAMVFLDEDRISFSSRISLSGQFSTTTRFLYKGGPIDSTINPIYREKVWEFGEEQDIGNVEVIDTDNYFPFRTLINAEYSVSGIISTKNDTVLLDLSGCIKHIIYRGFKAENRFTDFYADFTGTDSYAWMLEFDQTVSFYNLPENMEVNNNFGTYKFSIKQMDDNKLLISSYFKIKSNQIKKNNIEQVAHIYNAIEDNSKILLTIGLREN
ncbi:MAG: hypothetical protein GXO89_05030 [Chlorobi bacterium]|nr:hypothetical protein [Chlorobiota bacterium]